MRAEEIEGLLPPVIAQWTKHALVEPNQRIHCDWERDDGETCTQTLRARFTLDNDGIITPSIVENTIGDLIAANEYLDEGNSELTVYRGNTVST